MRFVAEFLSALFLDDKESQALEEFLDLPELTELVFLLRRSSNNLYQLTRKVHETEPISSTSLIGLLPFCCNIFLVPALRLIRNGHSKFPRCQQRF